MLLRFWRADNCLRRYFEQKIMDVLVHQFSFVHKTITKPNINCVQPAYGTQTGQIHLFPNLTNRCIFIRLVLADMTFRKCPLPIGILHHGKVYQAIDTLKHKSSRGDFCAMAFALSFIPARGDRSPRQVGGHVAHEHRFR
jgi:hypothetical protein